jgi:dTDP-4-dehydrorhamnose 3,5-epimerase
MIINNTKIPEVKIITPEVFHDERGYFYESYHKNKFMEMDIPHNFPQDNHVYSKQGVIRGLHYQLKKSQGKLVRAVFGEIIDVAVDIRKGSSNFGDHVSVKLSDENKKMLYIPEGFAHGYSVLSKSCLVNYKCTNTYNAESEYGIIWNDPTLNIDWKIYDPTISSKDNRLPKFDEQKNLPEF